MKLKRSEKSVLASVRALLKARGILHFRRNVGAFKNGAGRHVAMGHPGEADIEALVRPIVWNDHNQMFVSRPTPLFIECKGSEGRQSPAQKLFQKTVEQYGCAYLLVRSAEEVETWLRIHVE